MSAARPEVSVIVPVRDGAGSLPALLGSLDRQTLDRARFEVIVVDNGSRDGTAQVAREGGARVVAEPIPNRARARNRGAAAARADRFAFTDADCEADPGWLEALLACAGRAPLLAGPVRVATGDPPNLVERYEALWRFAQEHWVADGWAATANLCVERAAFEEVGGLDPAYRHIGEDVDLCLRARRAGLALELCEGAVVYHQAEDRLSPMLRRAFFHGYSAGQLSRRMGIGEFAWRHPMPLVVGRAAMGQVGIGPERVDRAEWRRMSRLARLAYGARMAGSAWAELRRVR
ncbi:MAG TPA: glycosyltransferase [Solirubrobacteraceae bacterium]|nr:glycosyltransferase [Solirubrobacteraceae bacterium]